MSLISKLSGCSASFSKSEHSGAVPILCKFWSEDGVWNGVAEHIPVAVVGETFEAAKENLRSAIGAHLEAIRESGDLDSNLETLLDDARDFFSVQDIPTGLAYARIEVRVTGDHVCAFA